ncbi:hypothetical protein, partial [Escherichia coli]|uniref:hypothetical protein n=1 Tax=Escherichia coli TaxID=562 RepID=UPI001BDCD309
NKALPLSVMTLLILTSLHWQQPKPMSMSLGLSPLLVAEILALLVVLLSYHWKKRKPPTIPLLRWFPAMW